MTRVQQAIRRVMHGDGVWIVHGQSFPDTQELTNLTDFLEHRDRSPLRWICQRTGPLDLVFFDPVVPAVHEWAVVQKYCRPKFVLINNVNLPVHAGWIHQHLLAMPEWYEIATGVLELDEVSHNFLTTHFAELGMLYAIRRWALMMRAS